MSARSSAGRRKRGDACALVSLLLVHVSALIDEHMSVVSYMTMFSSADSKAVMSNIVREIYGDGVCRRGTSGYWRMRVNIVCW
jgi:hypothetical protein